MSNYFVSQEEEDEEFNDIEDDFEEYGDDDDEEEDFVPDGAPSGSTPSKGKKKKAQEEAAKKKRRVAFAPGIDEIVEELETGGKKRKKVCSYVIGHIIRLKEREARTTFKAHSRAITDNGRSKHGVCWAAV